MFRLLSLFSIFLSVLLMGCSPPTIANSPTTTTSDSQVQAPVSKGQNLPITAQATIPKGTKIKLEVARTPEQQMMGLMYRPALPDDQGMMFVFPSAQPVSFWMKNVPVALDMVFMENGKVKYIQTAAPSCQDEPCPTYGPNVPINQVIELRAERAKELGLQVGDHLEIEFLNPGNSQ
ncbi:DUF192 domain-containing protein [Anabaena sp. PCC 7108]|uniref:DUF192 domain-containing protein n=1 Tax=Anabaena sp. PCC 7108 TaxID=163908 RepID=UPI00047642F8|nr:DUF192 domain-containing protein [Anabaena sp. PCC 7108]